MNTPINFVRMTGLATTSQQNKACENMVSKKRNPITKKSHRLGANMKTWEPLAQPKVMCVSWTSTGESNLINLNRSINYDLSILVR